MPAPSGDEARLSGGTRTATACSGDDHACGGCWRLKRAREHMFGSIRARVQETRRGRQVGMGCRMHLFAWRGEVERYPRRRSCLVFGECTWLGRRGQVDVIRRAGDGMADAEEEIASSFIKRILFPRPKVEYPIFPSIQHGDGGHKRRTAATKADSSGLHH